MNQRSAGLPASCLLASLLLAPLPLRAQAVDIEHKAIECIVAGKFPKMNACFKPAGSLSRSRVFFRVEGTPKWYYVDMKSDAPCFSGILPKPKKALLKKKIEYYVQATGKSFAEGQTETYLPLVVSSESECQNRPVAAYVTKATVAVFPSVPAGFAGGAALSTGVIAAAGVVGAGAAAAGAVAVAKSNDTTPTTVSTAPTTSPTTAPAVTTTTTTTTTTTLPSASNKPPNAVFKVNPDPPSGKSPLTVGFNMCQSTDPDGDPLEFKFNFGDGKTDKGFCRMDHTYTATSLRARADTTFPAEICVTDGIEGHQRCKGYGVAVVPPQPRDPCNGDTTGPNVSIAGPPSVYPAAQPYPINFTANASDPAGVAKVKYTATAFYQGPAVDLGESTSAPFTVSITQSQASILFGCNSYGNVTATALDTCNNQKASAPVAYNIDTSQFCAAAVPSGASARRVAWTNEIDVPGGQGQVIVNGSAAFYPRAGRSMGVSEVRGGENRIEAVLVESKGQAGAWRFEFAAGSIAPGSLHVVAGEVALVTTDAVVFRIRGTVGERLVFTFRTSHPR